MIAEESVAGHITFLGTGTSTGVPVLGCDCETCRSADRRDSRLRTSALVEMGGQAIIIDAGPDFRQQTLRIGLRRLDAILVTHEHYDHVSGLDDVRGVNYATGQAVNVFAMERVATTIRRNLCYVFTPTPYPGSPKMTLTEVEAGKPFFSKDIEIVPLDVLHNKLQILGFRIGPLAYITDASALPQETLEAIAGVDTLVINSLGPFDHPSHFSLEESLAVAQQVSARQTFFTHIGHRMGPHGKAEETMPEGIHLAYDGLRVEIRK